MCCVAPSKTFTQNNYWRKQYGKESLAFDTYLKEPIHA